MTGLALLSTRKTFLLMKKFVLLLLTMGMLNIPVHADSFSSLWKQVEAAQQKDMPKTVVELLDKIVVKAETERAYGHLLKAQVMNMCYRSSVSAVGPMPRRTPR